MKMFVAASLIVVICVFGILTHDFTVHPKTIIATRSPSPTTTPAMLTPPERDKQYVEYRRIHYGVVVAGDAYMLNDSDNEILATQEHISELEGRVPNIMLRAELGMCLAKMPKNPKNIAECKRAFQKLDKMHENLEKSLKNY